MRLIELSPGRRLIIKAGRLFDGAGANIQKNTNIYIMDHKIIAVEPSDTQLTDIKTKKNLTTSEKTPAGANIPDHSTEKWLQNECAESPPAEFYCNSCHGGVSLLDLTNCTILPGLIDCHVHLALDGKDFNNSLGQWSDHEKLGERVKKDLHTTLENGIAAVRDGGDLNGIGLSFRNQIARGLLKGPLIKASGKALGKKGKYGSFLGPGFETHELAETVRKLAAGGVDQIKVLVSGVVSFKEYRRVGEIQFTRRELTEIVNAARDMGLKVMAHASSDQAVQIAVRAGVDTIEHGYFISPQSIEEMAGAGIFWVPTIVPVANQTGKARRNIYSAGQLEIIEKTYRRQQNMLCLAAEAGVRLGLGTDAGATGVLHGQGYLEELLLYREAGLTPEKIMLAATSGGAAALGLGDELGTIRPGMPAYLIAVEGNPFRDLSLIANIKYVIRPGTIINSENHSY